MNDTTLPADTLSALANADVQRQAAQMAQDAIHARYSPSHSSGTPGTSPTSELAWKHDEFQAILT